MRSVENEECGKCGVLILLPICQCSFYKATKYVCNSPL